jgi:hypothetical protein
MELSPTEQRQVLEALARSVIGHAGELTDLGRAIGDADHGINMQRGFEAVLAELDGLAAKPLGDALQAMGMTLVMKVGGASGPLYGTLFMAIGRSRQHSACHARARREAGVRPSGVGHTPGRRPCSTYWSRRWRRCAPVPTGCRASPAGRGGSAGHCPMPAARAGLFKGRSIGTMIGAFQELMIAAVCDCMEARCQTTT